MKYKHFIIEHGLIAALNNIKEHLPSSEAAILNSIIVNCIETLSEDDLEALTKIVLDNIDEYIGGKNGEYI